MSHKVILVFLCAYIIALKFYKFHLCNRNIYALCGYSVFHLSFCHLCRNFFYFIYLFLKNTYFYADTEPRKLPPLSLHDRLRVAVNVARCLSYLHNEKAIPHGNLKSTNILLQPPNMNPLLSDYSLHRILTSAGTAEQVLNAGALGYRPPEFASSSKPCPSLKSDVYAFGVILLELLTGKGSGEIVSGDPGVVDLTEWVRLLAQENRCSECYDKLLLNEPNAEAPRILGEMLQVGLRCILPASERPDMKSVFEDLSMIVL